ncbi:hypothetical protein SCLCIDRAFT_174337 [Scleroderma citrinum Foug A]|uniref:Uncharacterized protein n=1 Tax=Scleroderma citrinum Foug A TaxID=1036808 RepID=A0A0C3AAS1_9AGAM|nr:hypothetical protein SCLCIDRAFT_174337 [Scleroderma citrinum Foug A]
MSALHHLQLLVELQTFSRCCIQVFQVNVSVHSDYLQAFGPCEYPEGLVLMRHGSHAGPGTYLLWPPQSRGVATYMRVSRSFIPTSATPLAPTSPAAMSTLTVSRTMTTNVNTDQHWNHAVVNDPNSSTSMTTPPAMPAATVTATTTSNVHNNWLANSDNDYPIGNIILLFDGVAPIGFCMVSHCPLSTSLWFSHQRNHSIGVHDHIPHLSPFAILFMPSTAPRRRCHR